MSKIKILSDTTISRIAAGEVIERPASAVKELVENAIDAGADSIDIILEQAGKNLIIISDNGCGLSKEELKIAVLRHATSKLDEDDLMNINSFGFRGEALPSIAAISRMNIASKIKSEKAYQIQIDGGQNQGVSICNIANGTRIEIRDLFFATPARLKFLRSDRTELLACLEIIKRLSLAHSHISFSVQHEGKIILKYKANNSNSVRIEEVLGQDFYKNAISVNYETKDFTIKGYFSPPSFYKSTTEDQFLFINNRPIKDKIIASTIKFIYQDFLSRDKQPSFALFLKINPQLIDFNVHPAKNEVRFHDPNQVRKILTEAIKPFIATAYIPNSIVNNFSSSPIGFFNSNNSNKNSYNNNFSPSTNSRITPSNKVASLMELGLPFQSLNKEPSFSPIKVEDNLINNILDDNLKFEAGFTFGPMLGKINNKYIVTLENDNLYLIDLKIALELINAQEITDGLNSKDFVKKRLAFPLIIELKTSIEIDNMHKMMASNNHGLTIEIFNESSFMISEIPDVLGEINPHKLISTLLEYFKTNQNLDEAILAAYKSVSKIDLSLPNKIITQNLELLAKMLIEGQVSIANKLLIKLSTTEIEKLFCLR